MRQSEPVSLWQAVEGTGNLENRWLHGADASIPLSALAGGSSLGTNAHALRGRSVVLAVDDQLTASLALLELDGVARRVTLCPPDLAPEHLPAVIEMAGAQAIVSERRIAAAPPDMMWVQAFGCAVEPRPVCRQPGPKTEWVLLTSGTTGVPKLVAHTLATLTGAIGFSPPADDPPVWSTFYDIRRYGGLQIFLRGILGGGSLVLSNAKEPVARFLARVARAGVTHISGTPSHWRRALMSPEIAKIAPRYARLSGEIADQAILDQLQATFPKADVAHAFASTEAGVAFDVGDGLAGFPASVLETAAAKGVELRIEDGSLRIRSKRIGLGYLGDNAPNLFDENGFVDTHDIVELRDGRYHFVGRRGGVVNIGGAKVHPEEIEAVINRHPRVRMSLVRARRSPITGAIVVADVVVNLSPGDPRGEAESPADTQALKGEILDICRTSLARHKVPADIRFVSALEVGASGKISRTGG